MISRPTIYNLKPLQLASFEKIPTLEGMNPTQVKQALELGNLDEERRLESMRRYEINCFSLHEWTRK